MYANTVAEHKLKMFPWEWIFQNLNSSKAEKAEKINLYTNNAETRK